MEQVCQLVLFLPGKRRPQAEASLWQFSSRKHLRRSSASGLLGSWECARKSSQPVVAPCHQKRAPLAQFGWQQRRLRPRETHKAMRHTSPDLRGHISTVMGIVAVPICAKEVVMLAVGSMVVWQLPRTELFSRCSLRWHQRKPGAAHCGCVQDRDP